MSGRTQVRKLPRGRPINAGLGPAIMDAVLVLLAEQGYARLTTAAVAHRAGVSTATLYRRWPSKRDLILAAAQQIADEETTDIDTGTIESDLRELFAHKRRALSGRVGSTLVALAGESVHDPELAAILRSSILDPTRKHLAVIFTRGAARGEQVTQDAESAAHLVVGAVLARIAFGPAPGSSVGRDETHDLLPETDATLLVRAIAGTAR